MARVSDVELERLKKEVSVQRLAEARGVELKRHGADLVGLCPFHADKTPSLVVTPAKNLWHCLGACQAGGSVVDWVMKAEGVSFRHAIELLRNDVLAPAEGGRVVKVGTVRKLPAPVRFDADDQAVLRQVVDYYHSTLKQSPEALAYLEKRGLSSTEMVDRFKLGFANRTLGLRLPLKNRDAGAAIRARLQKLGVLRESGHEHFAGSIVIPIHDADGNVVSLYGRKVTASLRPGTPLHLYLPGPHRGVFNETELACHKSVILCEALIDALSFWVAGFRNVTASYGVEGFTDGHLEAFKRNGIDRALIAYDRDDAGEKAAEALAKRLVTEGFECYRVQFPRGMDANEYALKVMPASKSLGLAIRQAVWLGKGQGAPVPEYLGKPVEAPAPRPPASPLVAEAARPSAPGAGAMGPIIPASAMAILEQMGPDAVAAAQSGAATAVALLTGFPVRGAEPVSTGPEVASSKSGRSTSSVPPPPATKLEPSAPPPPSNEAAPVDPKSPEASTEVKDEEVVLTLGERRYRVRGLARNSSFDSLKVNLLASKGDAFHVDTLEMYSAKARAAYVKQAAEELRLTEDVVKHDLGHVLRKLEELQHEAICKAAESKTKAVALSDAERDEALALLKEPKLLDRILADFQRCGVVGEETNKLVGYLAAVSRKLEEPLAVIIQSSSAAGKTSLMDAVLSLVPEEDRVKYSAMTGQSLFYMGDVNLKHKVLAIAEEEGASRASYALKLLQSEGELTIASTGKDAATGRLVTHEYRVEGPVMLFLTTTAIELDEELLNRCLVLTVDEDREQTRAIHQLQRERQTLEGLLARRERDAVVKLHRDAQRLLRPLLVANPFAKALTFLDDRTRMRREHTKYLTLIRTIALLHQYQRPVKTVTHRGQVVEYIEVTREDLAVANRLAHQVLGRSLDELPPQTRRLLLLLEAMVTQGCAARSVSRRDFRFTRREVREKTGWGNTQLKIHLRRLEELEYVAAHSAARGPGFVYELAYDGQGQDGTPFMAGLVDVEQLGRCENDVDRSGLDAHRSGVSGQKSGAGRPLVGPRSGGGRGGVLDENEKSGADFAAAGPVSGGNAHLEGAPKVVSYSQGVRPVALVAVGSATPGS